MTRIKLALAALAAASLAAALAAAPLAAAPASQSATILVATVGPGFTITLKSAGKTVKKLKPGTYVVRVSDKSNIHNFHLKGPAVNKLTSVAAVGTKSWTVKLKAGKYTYVCDPHASSMKGSFTVAA
jgi:plastocyanin